MYSVQSSAEQRGEKGGGKGGNKGAGMMKRSNQGTSHSVGIRGFNTRPWIWIKDDHQVTSSGNCDSV